MTQNPNADAEINALLADLWQRHLPLTRERLAFLESTAKLSGQGSLDEQGRVEAQSIAHKLSGNLGMFGHQQAGSIASEIEGIFRAPTEEALSRLGQLVQRLRQELEPYF